MANFALKTQSTNQIKEVIDKFYNINRRRLIRTEESLNYNQRDFLSLIPLLFHFKNPDLPGYVSEETPVGIADYSPGNSAITSVKKHFPAFKMERKALHHMDIHSIFCMGSSGTIAYSNKSDFDFWLIHAHNLPANAVEELTEKARLIEEWAMCLRLEVHFFVFDDLTFKQGHHDNLSSESSGSAQHYLLIDEFYRSGLLIAGLPPIWWLVPAEHELEYEKYIQSLIDSDQIVRDDYVDFGNMSNIPADEFFGAAVWQLYKGIDSPYKSVMKLLLMEVYASEYPDINLLSIIFKKAVYSGETEFANLDPYIMMYRKVEDYLMTRQEKGRLDLFRKCFYFKINLRVSQNVKQENSNWQREMVKEMVMDWGWNHEKLLTMDTMKNWRMDNVIQERNALIKEFTQSYQFLSDFAKQHSEVSRLNQSELNVLGRKLYAAFERKSGKVEIINRGIAPDLMENELTIHQSKHKDGTDRFQLFSTDREHESSHEKPKPIKRSQSIIELLAWGFFNKVIGENTAISIQSQTPSITAKELKDILAAFERLFPGGKIQKPSFNDLSCPARINMASLFINVGIKSQPKTGDVDQHLSSSRIDALSYGGFHENLAKTFDMVIATSWEEILIYRYSGVDGMTQCLIDYLRWTTQHSQTTPARINAFSFGTSYASNIARRIEELFTSIISAYYEPPHSEHTRYVFLIEDDFYITNYQDGGLIFTKVGNSKSLKKTLASPRTNFSQVIFDSALKWHSPVPDIYKLNKSSTIQMFFYAESKEAHLYIIDERGSLFNQVLPFIDGKSLINHYVLFFKSIAKRRNLLINGNSQPIEEISSEFYLLTKKRNQYFSIKKIDVAPKSDNLNFFNIQVLGDLDKKDNTTLSIYCQDEEFSTVDYGGEIFNAVANHVLELRDYNRAYPIYITDIDPSRGLFFGSDVEHIQTIHFLEYKRRIEARLNEVFKR